MIFSNHGLERFLQRTKMQEEDLRSVIELGAFVSLGKSKEGRSLCLFFNPADNKYDVAIIAPDNTVVSVVEESFRGIAHKVKGKHRQHALKEFQQLILVRNDSNTDAANFSVEMSVYYHHENGALKKYEIKHDCNTGKTPRCKNLVLAAENELKEIIHAVEEISARYSEVSIEFVLSHSRCHKRKVYVNLHVARDILVSQNLIPA